MKKIILNIAAFAVLSTVFVACGDTEKGKHEDNHTEEHGEKAPEKCLFMHDPNHTDVRWTSFKHTAKAPVRGEFLKFDIVGKKAETITALLSSFTMKVEVESINSGDSLRDVKLRKFFFGSMENTEFIEGKIESVTENGGIMSMKMNDVTQKVDFSYTVSEDLKLELKAEIDVNKFSGEAALTAINDACADKHTGKDGVKKIWSTVEILIISQLVKECE